MAKLSVRCLTTAALCVGSVASFAMLCVSVAHVVFLVPFYVEREAGELARRLDRMIAAEADAEWVRARLGMALATDPRDWNDIDLILEIADDVGVALDPALAAQVEQAREKDHTIWRRALRCGTCVVDIGRCPDFGTLVFCRMGMELVPVVGDASVLLRNANAWRKNEPVDELETGLAIFGLASTATAVAPIKIGATATRVALRARLLKPPLVEALTQQARALAPRWDKLGDFVAGRAALREIVDSRALARFRDTVADLGRLRRAAGSNIDALRLLRVADNPGDAARLARVAEKAGPARTVKAVRALPKYRVLRALMRMSDYAIQMIAWAVALAALLTYMAGSGLLRSILHGKARC